MQKAGAMSVDDRLLRIETQLKWLTVLVSIPTGLLIALGYL